MTENTEPEPYEVETDAEIRMRADFMEARAISDRIARDPESYDPADSADIGDYSNPWLSGPDRWTSDWLYLSEATERWREDPETAAAALTVRASALSPIELRSEEQARHIAEHGFEQDSSGMLTSDYATRVWEREGGYYGLATKPVTELDGYDTAPTWGDSNAAAGWGATNARDGMQW
ncbi:hypothetical protein [Nocardia arizonensis]|uniref:hypothetical protein n=1 Tax=Nocardia arizonensis TaxID=1141647 RepID=UPI0006D10453|nr:hypothetical protein [Nocardia arizonensis]